MFIVLTEEEFEKLKNPGPAPEDSEARAQMRKYLTAFMEAIVRNPYNPMEYGSASQWADSIKRVIGEPPAL